LSDILVTGGSGGIGTAFLNRINVLSDCKIWNMDQKPNSSTNPNVHDLICDLSKSPESTEKFLRDSLDSRNIEMIVHIAGWGGPYIPITEVDAEMFQKIQNTNLGSFYSICKVLLPILKSKGGGRIVAVLSSLSINGSKNSVAYSSAKHGLLGFIKSVADEWGSMGVRINGISPGYIDTSMGIQKDIPGHREEILSRTPTKTIGSPDDVAKLIEYLLFHDSGYVNGANWTIDGGMTSI
jgi:3-oxoacyl-[acyl-carrier protein] reductase